MPQQKNKEKSDHVRLMPRLADDGTISFKFTEKQIEDLLETLHFAMSAAAIFAQQEITKGGSVASASKMNRIATDARRLHTIVLQHAEIGQPELDNIN